METEYGDISLRDYFAGCALTGGLASEDERYQGRGTGIGTPAQNADIAYEIADAMLERRERTT